MTHNEFIEKIAGYVQKYAHSYGIEVHSPIIAQAILESGWGESKLAAKYHNYFGLKCGSRWKGRSVNLSTKEEYTAGTLTTINDNFRVYDSIENGVKGYFEFLQLSRYHNLRGIRDPETYLKTIKADGYATSSTYVENNMRLIRQYDLTKYDLKEETLMGRTATDLINVMRSWIGFSESNGKHRQIIDLYNSHKPLARGYAVKYTDAWCDTCVSAAAIKAGMTDLIGTECGCEQHVKIFKAKGIWIEDGRITPKPGYIILYNWDDSTQPNDGGSDHIGVVETVSGNQITVIEGNKNNAVGRRTIPVGWGYIRGYAAPKYDAESKIVQKLTVEAAARKVIAGEFGNGEARKEALEALGLDYTTVQRRVNAILSSPAQPKVYYTVVSGDTLSGIARKHGITLAALLKLNPSIKNPDLIYPGQKIRIR